MMPSLVVRGPRRRIGSVRTGAAEPPLVQPLLDNSFPQRRVVGDRLERRPAHRAAPTRISTIPPSRPAIPRSISTSTTSHFHHGTTREASGRVSSLTYQTAAALH